MDKTYNVLIVEDDKSWQRRFKRYLKREPFVISVTDTYQKASALIEKQTFDLVILDVNLTGVVGNYDGLRVGHEVWHKDRTVKIIIVSGSDSARKRLSSFNFVPSYILEKQTIDQNEFIKKVYQALRQPSLPRKD